MRVVKVSGSYVDNENYLDIHFRLMREDMLSPLRDQILKYRRYSESTQSVSCGLRYFCSVRYRNLPSCQAVELAKTNNGEIPPMADIIILKVQ